MKALLFSLCVIISCTLSAQTCREVMFSGKVMDTMEHQTFYNLMLINKRTGKGVFGLPNGSFSLYVSNGDTLTISVQGYELIRFLVQADSNCQCKKQFYLMHKAKLLEESVIRPLKSLDQIREEREALAMRETRTVTGAQVFESPITFLYEAFSKKEQNKRWIAEQTYKDDQRKVVKELLRLYISYDIIDLSEEEFDAFISFLNLNDAFLKTASEMDLITFIKDKYLHFRQLPKE